MSLTIGWIQFQKHACDCQVRTSTMLAAGVLIMALPAIAADKGYAVTAYGNYRGGGNFTDAKGMNADRP